MALRLLLYGIPGGPIFPLGERIAQFHKLDFFSIEKVPDERDSYFDDTIKEVQFDTGDFMNGSASQHMVRSPGALRIDQELILADPMISDTGEYEDALQPEELDCVFSLEQGVVATDIPDRHLIDWATHVLFLDADQSDVVAWFSKRRHCPTCKAVYHMEEKVPIVAHRCTRCGTDLITNDEDQPEAVRDQFKFWRNAFWRFQETAKQQKKHKRIDIDKMKSFSDLASRVNLWVRDKIEDTNNWWSRAKDGITSGEDEILAEESEKPVTDARFVTYDELRQWSSKISPAERLKRMHERRGENPDGTINQDVLDEMDEKLSIQPSLDKD